MNLNLLNVGFLGASSGFPFYTSLYESFNPLTVLNKSHFVEWFSGAALRSIWTQTNISGTGTFAMVDSIDEGFSVKSGASNANESQINFNNIRHYSNTSSALLVLYRRVSATTKTQAQVGLNNLINGSGLNSAVTQDYEQASFKTLVTTDGLTATSSNSAVAIDTSWHLYKIVCGASSVTLTIDGANLVTNTTHLPTTTLQPEIDSYAGSTSLGAAETRVKYLEAYNI